MKKLTFLKKRLQVLSIALPLLSAANLDAEKPHHEPTLPSNNPTPTVYQLIAQENLKTLTTVGDKNNNGFSSMIKDLQEQGFDKVAQAKFEQQLHPNPQQRRTLMLTLLTGYEKERPLPPESVLDFGSISDLELLCGPKSNATLYLATIVDRTTTECGRMLFYRKLIQPTNNYQKLANQQQVIRELVNNQPLFDQLNTQLTNLAVPENALLSFWDAEDLFTFVVEQMQFHLPASSKLQKIQSASRWLNTSPTAVEATYLCIRSLINMGNFLSVYGAIALPMYALTGKSIIPYLPAEDFKKLAPLSFSGIVCWVAARGFSSKHIPTTIATSEYAYQVYRMVRDFKTNDLFDRCIHDKLQYAATYLNTAKRLTEIITQHPVLATQFPAVAQFKRTLETLNTKNSELSLLFTLLEAQSIAGAYSSWFLHWGVIWVAYRLLLDHKNELLEAMHAVGEIDAQLSIAKLYKEFNQKQGTFCFPTYREGQEKPCLDATNFWNPFIDAQRVIPSSLHLGASYQSPNNAIITGPNAGGKSTITKALILNIILAQSLGIAPAQALTFTPFTKIITYLNIVDDIAAANSHFKAGVLRAREVVNTMQALQPGQWGLTAIDEVFNGTTFIEGQAAAYCLFKLLGENQRSMCITCTHFPLVPLLESKTGTYTNYKVSVIETATNLKYPFILERGISNQIITLKILQAEGFNAQFIEQAQQLIDPKQ